MAAGPAFLHNVDDLTVRLCYINFDGEYYYYDVIIHRCSSIKLVMNMKENSLFIFSTNSLLNCYSGFILKTNVGTEFEFMAEFQGLLVPIKVVV